MWQDLKNMYHLFVAILANLWHGFPSKKLTVIGVTGTDGKTTTTALIYHILNCAGKKVAMVSTVGAAVEGKTYDVGFHVTTPSSFAIQKYLKLALQKGCKYVVLETTSHAIHQKRVFGVHFAIGVLTNVTHEHLDYHKTYDRYLKVKLRLLENAKVGIVNRDDMSYEKIQNLKFRIQNLVTYGMMKNADINPKVFPFQTKLFGEFNQYNCLAAIAVCKQLGLTEDEIRNGVSSFTAPIGRQEVVYKDSFSVMIDFAHTPNAFAKLLPAIKPKEGRLIHVFGSAGARDAKKRPEMGKIAAEFDDVIILTAEDPRGEPVEKINE
ncbi:MAG TPA: UDP-N-acetylmuramyl-tripeptide synthetase, partial [Candidatus Saccharimonadales bacterium]|nr:UDP-N-acetylmuramyl-tripeptide synthetase [Candidatus Saccharimonadales bacterium]